MSATSFCGLLPREGGGLADPDDVFPDWSPPGSVHRTPQPVHKIGSFAAIAGMSPSLGVPPVDCFFFPPSGSPASNASPAPVKARRKRHFSLEDCQDEMILDQDSSSCSNDSSGLFPGSKKGLDSPGILLIGDIGDAGLDHNTCFPDTDLRPIKSFINEMSSEDSLDLDLGTAVSESLRSEFEARLLQLVEDCDQAQLTFPEGLLPVIAGHVLQEASGEPYGLKGCLLHIQYEGHTALHHLATLDCDPDTVAKTFELTLTLRQAQTSWGQRMARRLSFSSSPLAVSTSYKLVKRRKYRTNQ